MFRWKAGEVAPAINIPMLVLTGSRDIVTLPAAGQEIVTLAPVARLVEVDCVDHMGFMEYSDVYNRELAAFAGEVFGTLEEKAGV